ncbi:hypothetical protein JVU11DRAFT_9633 [Chiua virens]|nr:hypothetical protein JVU11DRAFT_9633 [Chiua virens]
MQYPQDFPDLPHALEVLRQEDGGDPLRLRIHADHIHFQMIPLFGVLQTEVGDTDWAGESAHKLGQLFCALSDAALAAAERDTTAEIVHIMPVQHHVPGDDRSPGRPPFECDQEWLENAIAPTRRLSLQTIAQTLGIHRNTLRRYLQINGLVKTFSDITDAEIDVLVRNYKLERPNAGLQFVLASLKSHGLNIQ